MVFLDNENWITINCGDLKLTDIEGKFVLANLQPLSDLSPDSSHFILDITDEGDGVRGILKINSQSEVFLSEVRATNVIRMTTELKKDILKKIEFWRNSRFLSHAKS